MVPPADSPAPPASRAPGIPETSAPTSVPGPRADAAPASGQQRQFSAAEFRARQHRQERRRWALIGAVVVVAVIGLSVALGPGGRGGSGASHGSSPGGLTIDFGAPVVATATCLNGQSTMIEAVPWLGASAPISTGEINLELVELIDGDIDGGPVPYPNVTGNYLCGTTFQTAWAAWYVVLENPAGTNLAFFSYSQGWVNIAQAGQGVPITNGSSLTLVSDPSFAGLSFALCVLGDVEGSTINACAQL